MLKFFAESRARLYGEPAASLLLTSTSSSSSSSAPAQKQSSRPIQASRLLAEAAVTGALKVTSPTLVGALEELRARARQLHCQAMERRAYAAASAASAAETSAGGAALAIEDQMQEQPDEPERQRERVLAEACQQARKAAEAKAQGDVEASCELLRSAFDRVDQLRRLSSGSVGSRDDAPEACQSDAAEVEVVEPAPTTPSRKRNYVGRPKSPTKTRRFRRSTGKAGTHDEDDD
eukprot:TRINITY_DN8199_c0_g1_i2.p1 TRINITY_DN8199_c0_g1~~TRINITY_DN8199_c0_g1_i2.p1  ORF type:complete len:234 (-),score=68.57 TRINITY_DN8199_c0_g1_i2:372-1073(-)